MNESKRKAGDYEIIHALRIGEQEIVVGENQTNTDGQKYMCAFCQQNDFFARYDEVLASNDYPEILGIFGQRVAEQAEKTRTALLTPKIQGIPNEPLNASDCTPISSADDLNDQVVVIRQEVLRREYRRATNQIALCTGGFGASPNSRGSACYCVNLYTGKTSRFERRDILGVLKDDQMPKWAKHGLLSYQQKEKTSRAQER